MAKDSRIGESLWFIWDGEDYDFSSESSIVFYTKEHVDLEEDLIRKALASAIQREGIADSLSGGFSLISSGITQHLYSGYSPISEREYICDSNGVSSRGEDLLSVIPVTVVEVFDVF